MHELTCFFKIYNQEFDSLNSRAVVKRMSEQQKANSYRTKTMPLEFVCLRVHVQKINTPIRPRWRLPSFAIPLYSTNRFALSHPPASSISTKWVVNDHSIVSENTFPPTTLPPSPPSLAFYTWRLTKSGPSEVGQHKAPSHHDSCDR